MFDFHSLDLDMHTQKGKQIANLRIDSFVLKLDMLDSGALTLDFQ